MNRIKNGEEVRIWYSDSPCERCGLLWFMAELRNISDKVSKVYTVKLPKYIFNEETNTITELLGWGEVCPADWHKYLKFTQDKTKEYWGLCTAMVELKAGRQHFACGT